MKPKNLLVICNNFPDKNNVHVGGIFVKEQITYLKNCFENVYVISPIVHGVEYLRKTHNTDYEFDNVHVYFPRYVNIPLFYFYARYIWIYLEKRSILKLIQRERLKFDIIHAHFTWPSGAVAVELKNKFHTPVIITEHASATFKKAIEGKDPIFTKCWKLCNAIIRVRKCDIQLFDNVGISSEKVHYIPNGYDDNKFGKSDKFVCKGKLNLPTNRKVILTVGNMYDKIKGHEYLIDAMCEIVKYRKDVLCVIVGSGKLKNKLEDKTKNANMGKYIIFSGGISHNDISVWMNTCDIFVLPSLVESFGIVQIEAMACGKPVVATFNGGSEEIIVSDDYGLLCEPANPKDLAEKILIALEKEWNSEKILKYAKTFNMKKISDEIESVYKRVMTNV